MRSSRLLLLLCLLSLAGCATQPVAPWQRGRLAEPRMAFEPDPSLAAFRQHMFASKEAASARLSAAGGGCGCN